MLCQILKEIPKKQQVSDPEQLAGILSQKISEEYSQQYLWNRLKVSTICLKNKRIVLYQHWFS
jgi:hypothetical protein